MDLVGIHTKALEGMDEIAKMTDEARYAYITESVFKAEILPLLVSETKDMNLGRWLDLAGTALRGFKVLSEDNENILFTVPPLLKDNGAHTVPPEGHSVNEIIMTSIKKRNVLPKLADRYINETLTNNMIKGTVDVEAIEQLNHIFSIYGYKKRYDVTTSVSKGSDTPNTDTDLGIDGYEDF